MKIVAIKCEDKYYVAQEEKENYRKYNSDGLCRLFFDGALPKKSCHKNWLILKGVPKKIEKLVSQPDINHRYVLIDEDMQSDKAPMVLEKDVVTHIVDGYTEWRDEYSKLRSLYREESDKQDDVNEAVEFEWVLLMEVKEVREYEGFAYDVQKTQWANEGTTKLKEGEVQHQLIDKIIFPDILLPARPCEFTSGQTYRIVRQYIKQHMNYEVAEITSDYNFCFTVKKKIALAVVEKYMVDVNLWHKRRKPKHETRYRNSRLVEVFAMTFSPENYGGYEPIKGFRGDNQEDLKKKIDSYCKALVKTINEPLNDCPDCRGMGVVLNKKKDKEDS